ncbi:MAG: hypothetical protein M3494_02235 [Actinomycetota bacterium]|jgi:hypothetical protein|nr:hypothetical protein [Actinomycetota bacterium]
MTSSTEPPKQPYILAFEGGDVGSLPLAVMVSDRGAVPLFDSREEAGSFLASTGLGGEFSPVEVSTSALISTLEAVSDEVEYVAINPPPESESGMKVRMGSLAELIEALREGRDEVDLFDFLGGNGSG